MRSLSSLEVKGRKVFLRVDFNVPLDDKGNIRDDSRIKASLPTLTYLISNKARVVVCSHLGRPKGKVDPKLSLKPVAGRLSELLGIPVKFAGAVVGPEVEALKNDLQDGEVLLLENVRFQAAETSNDDSFAGQLSQGIDIYINDAFGACHRAHASVVAIARHVKISAPGFLLQKEVDYLSRAVRSPQKPYAAILGGAKVSDKIPVIENLINKADDILIGGAMAYTFFKAQGLEVGRSLVEEDKKDLALKILEEAKEKKVNLLLPLDHVLATAAHAGHAEKTADAFPLPADLMAVDIGPRTVAAYSQIISRAKTIFWNGPLGVFEVPAFSQGTTAIARAIAQSKATSIVGGGDSVAAVAQAGLSDRITHISTGGGASLEFLAYETLPGLEALGWKKP
jgi:phosphoglycerate kinase